MPKKSGIVFVIGGAVLILSALLLFWHNEQEDRAAGRQAAAALEELQVLLEKQKEEAEAKETERDERDTQKTEGGKTEGTESDAGGVSSDTEGMFGEGPEEMRIVEIDGYGYIGYLSIPALQLVLPVMSDWDYDRLKVAPCRQFGAVGTEDLVIAGHNYDTFFAKLGSLQSGDAVTFTDMKGQPHEYIVNRVAALEPTEVEAVKNSGHALVLYTCNDTASLRIAVFCDKIENVSDVAGEHASYYADEIERGAEKGEDKETDKETDKGTDREADKETDKAGGAI